MSETLLTLRKKIDLIDNWLIKLLAQRRHLVIEIGQLKHKQGLSIYVPEREALMIEARRKKAAQMGISPELIEIIFHCIINESYRQQKNNTPTG